VLELEALLRQRIDPMAEVVDAERPLREQGVQRYEAEDHRPDHERRKHQEADVVLAPAGANERSATGVRVLAPAGRA
jgi:hypothetical protein